MLKGEASRDECLAATFVVAMLLIMLVAWLTYLRTYTKALELRGLQPRPQIQLRRDKTHLRRLLRQIAIPDIDHLGGYDLSSSNVADLPYAIKTNAPPGTRHKLLLRIVFLVSAMLPREMHARREMNDNNY
jgi:hypothetical protein